MKSRSISLEKIFYFIASSTLIVFILYVGRFVLAPIVFGCLFAVLLMPICRFFERGIRFRVPSILLAILAILIPLVGIILLFTFQMIDIFKHMPSITQQLSDNVDQFFNWLNQRWGITQLEGKQWIQDNLSILADAPVSFLQQGINYSTNFLFGLALMFITLFFVLLYRTAFKNFILMQVSSRSRSRLSEVLNNIQDIVRQYLLGMGLVIVIIGILNSVGLWIIGIDYAFFWGTLAACLTIVPYIGTTLGGSLPFIYAIATTETLWQPLAIVLMYQGIQQLEGNIITPMLVGHSVRINAFAAILSLILGGTIWGISGLILAIPLTAIVKIILDQYNATQPISLLLDNDLHKKRDKFLEEYDHDQHRLTNLLQKDSTTQS